MQCGPAVCIGVLLAVGNGVVMHDCPMEALSDIAPHFSLQPPIL